MCAEENILDLECRRSSDSIKTKGAEYPFIVTKIFCFTGSRVPSKIHNVSQGRKHGTGKQGVAVIGQHASSQCSIVISFVPKPSELTT